MNIENILASVKDKIHTTLKMGHELKATYPTLIVKQNPNLINLHGLRAENPITLVSVSDASYTNHCTVQLVKLGTSTSIATIKPVADSLYIEDRVKIGRIEAFLNEVGCLVEVAAAADILNVVALALKPLGQNTSPVISRFRRNKLNTITDKIASVEGRDAILRLLVLISREAQKLDEVFPDGVAPKIYVRGKNRKYKGRFHTVKIRYLNHDLNVVHYRKDGGHKLQRPTPLDSEDNVALSIDNIGRFMCAIINLCAKHGINEELYELLEYSVQPHLQVRPLEDLSAYVLAQELKYNYGNKKKESQPVVEPKFIFPNNATASVAQ